MNGEVYGVLIFILFLVIFNVKFKFYEWYIYY